MNNDEAKTMSKLYPLLDQSRCIQKEKGSDVSLYPPSYECHIHFIDWNLLIHPVPLAKRNAIRLLYIAKLLFGFFLKAQGRCLIIYLYRNDFDSPGAKSHAHFNLS